ncbi:hypothetical protein ScPMuIL_004605 [Solemya velum]
MTVQLQILYLSSIVRGALGPTEFSQELKFLSDIIDYLEIHPDKTRVGQITFSSYPVEYFQLNNYTDANSLKNQILNATHYRGGTDTAAALDLMLNSSFTTSHGARSKSIKIGIVVTDGASNDRYATITSANRIHDDERGIYMFAIGVDGAKEAELAAIASKPTETFSYFLSDFDSFSSIKRKIGELACSGLQRMIITVRDALAMDTSLVFQCNFDMKPNITYTVIWYRGDGSVIKTVEGLTEANLAGHNLNENETDGPGTNIRCAVEIGRTGDVVFVGESYNFFIGIIVLTPVLELQRTGPPTKKVLLQPTVPIRCHYLVSTCTFTVQQQQHSNSETVCGGWNMQMAQKCEQSLSLDNWNQTLEFDVSVQDSAGYNKGLDARILKLRVAKSPALNSYWEDYALPDVRVNVTLR